MSQCKYKPTKVKEGLILDDSFMKYEDDIRNNILDNWSKEKNQVFFNFLTNYLNTK